MLWHNINFFDLVRGHNITHVNVKKDIFNNFIVVIIIIDNFK